VRPGSATYCFHYDDPPDPDPLSHDLGSAPGA
jgi:hypothetical protein